MDKNILIFLVCTVFSLTVIIGSIVGIRRSPQYAIYSISKAVQSRDYSKFEKYVDVDSLIDNVFADAMKESTTEDAGIFSGLITSMAEGLKANSKAGLKQSIEEGSFANELLKDKSLLEVYWGVDVSKNGKIAEIKFTESPDVKFYMRQSSNVWRVTNIKGFSSITSSETEQEESRQVIEKGIGDLVSLATIEIKVNSASKVDKIPALFGDPEKPQSDNIFVKVNVTIKNIDESDLLVTDSIFVLADAEDNQFEAVAAFMSGDKNSLYGESIKPNLNKTGNLYFEVPKVSTGLTVRLSHKDKQEDYKVNLGL